MIKFSKEKVLLLHQLIAQETGGSIGVRDEGLLESALETAFSGFGGEEFPTVAARKNYRCRGNAPAGHEAQHILSKSEGDEIMSEIGIFVLGFTVTLAIICVANVLIESSYALK